MIRSGQWLEDAWTSNNGGNLEYTISGLSQGTSYDIQVRAENDEGTSGWSDQLQGRPFRM